MSGELIKHTFEGNVVRTHVDEADETWFCAKDVADALGIQNGREMLSALDDDEKKPVRISDGNRGNPNLTFMSEAGLYAIVLRSTKPAARRFSKWLRTDVLPTLRRTGSYSVSGSDTTRSLAVPSDMTGLMQVVRAYVEERTTPLEVDLEIERKRADAECARAEALLSERAKIISDMRSAERQRDVATRKLDSVAKHAYRAMKEALDEIDNEQSDLLARDDANSAAPRLALVKKD